MGKASASEAGGPRFEPPWLVQWSRWESRPLALVGNGAGAGTHPIDRKGSVFPRGTGRSLVIKGVHIASFRCLSEEITSFFRREPSCPRPASLAGSALREGGCASSRAGGVGTSGGRRPGGNLRLPQRANALMMLLQSCGGVGAEYPFTYLMREYVGALNQMLGVWDAFCDLCRYRSQRDRVV